MQVVGSRGVDLPFAVGFSLHCPPYHDCLSPSVPVSVLAWRIIFFFSWSSVIQAPDRLAVFFFRWSILSARRCRLQRRLFFFGRFIFGLPAPFPPMCGLLCVGWRRVWVFRSRSGKPVFPYKRPAPPQVNLFHPTSVFPLTSFFLSSPPFSRLSFSRFFSRRTFFFSCYDLSTTPVFVNLSLPYVPAFSPWQSRSWVARRILYTVSKGMPILFLRRSFFFSGFVVRDVDPHTRVGVFFKFFSVGC